MSVSGSDRPVVLAPLRPEQFREAATLLAQGIPFAPDVLARMLSARAAAGALPVLLSARGHERGPLLGAALLDRHRPVAGGRWFTRIAVAPRERGKGVGSALAAALRRCLPSAPAPLWVEVDLDDLRSQAVAAHWGAVAYQRSLALELDLTDASWRGRAAPPRPDLSVVALRPDSPEQEWQAAFAVYAAAALDLPDRAGAPAPSYEMFRAQVDHAPGVHVAWRRGTPVGLTGAGPEGPDSWYVFFTGTLGSARRTGVARVLKTALHEAAAREGVRTLSTSTLDANTAMLALNASLGYRTTGGVVRLEIT